MNAVKNIEVVLKVVIFSGVVESHEDVPVAQSIFKTGVAGNGGILLAPTKFENSRQLKPEDERYHKEVINWMITSLKSIRSTV